jgi:hypothetical protein
VTTQDGDRRIEIDPSAAIGSSEPVATASVGQV